MNEEKLYEYIINKLTEVKIKNKWDKNTYARAIAWKLSQMTITELIELLTPPTKGIEREEI